MHECPECGMACDCDGEDTWNDVAADDCSCSCWTETDDEGWDDSDDEKPAP